MDVLSGAWCFFFFVPRRGESRSFLFLPLALRSLLSLGPSSHLTGEQRCTSPLRDAHGNCRLLIADVAINWRVCCPHSFGRDPCSYMGTNRPKLSKVGALTPMGEGDAKTAHPLVRDTKRNAAYFAADLGRVIYCREPRIRQLSLTYDCLPHHD